MYIKFFLFAFMVLMCPTYIKSQGIKRRPHIILIYADDLGWNDVSFHGSPEIPTPNIDALALSGILLNNYYAQSLCSPSRGALMTGKYPIRLGLQHLVILPGEKSALPSQFTILPQHLQKLGYKTHMVGKWHLGHYHKELTPNHRGFDTFIGYYNGAVDYYDYTYDSEWNSKVKQERSYFGVDLHEGDNLITDFRNKYATTFFGERARDKILNHNTTDPLFLYVSHLAVHAAASTQHLQAPPEIVRKFKYISDKNRRIYAGVASVLDDTVGMLFEALDKKKMLQDTIILFLSDNGGEVDHTVGGYGSNFPLRGAKETLWEGGIRVPAIVWSPVFKLQEPRISHDLIHVTDWLPTLYRAAGGNPDDLGDIDGFDMWKVLTENVPSPRMDILHNIDPISGISAYRQRDFKVINGSIGFDSWYGPTGFEDLRLFQSLQKWVFKKSSAIRDVLVKNGMWIAKDAVQWYKRSRITCQYPPPESSKICNPGIRPCLFNIAEDPCEYVDLANVYPEIMNSLMNAIYDYQKVAVEPQFKPVDRRADPMCHNFSYIPWLDPEYFTECDYLS